MTRTKRHQARHRHGRGRIACLVAVMAAVVLHLVGASPSVDATEQRHRVADETHLLSPQARTNLETRLQSAQTRLGSPVYVHLVRQVHRETAVQMAERLLRTEAAAPIPANTNPVLILLAVSDNHAAVATDKGNAGIVPEVDAAEIVRQLEGRHPRQDLTGALGRAIDAVVESGLATAARRRPLPSSEDDLSREDLQGGQGGDDRLPSDAPDGSDSTMPAPPPPRSRMPIALGIAGLIIIALGLRRRRNMQAARLEIPVPPLGKPRLPSVIDSPPPRHRRPPTGEG